VRERQRVCGRPGRHEEHRHVALENLANSPLDRARDVVVAVPEREPAVAGSERLQNLRRDACGVVACEVHNRGNSRPRRV
jgi:hypothetical protein